MFAWRARQDPRFILDRRVQAGEVPMRVNSTGKVAKLNADTVDGSSAPMFAQVRADGTVDAYKGLTGNVRVVEGQYWISFERDITQCAYSAIRTDAQPGDIAVVQWPYEPSNRINIKTFGLDHNSYRDAPFHLVVNC